MDHVDWQGLYFDADADWPNRLMARARRRFGDSPDAEAAFNHALDAVSADDWARLRKGYRGTGSAEGFFAITFLNLLEDYAVRKYGRRRPPQWVQRLGPPWTRIYELLCLRRQAPEAIVALLHGEDRHPPDQLRQAIREVRGRIPDCGIRVGEEAAGEATPEPGDDATPLSALEGSDLAHLLGTLAGLLGGTAPAVPARASLAALGRALSLEARERLLLRLVYQENCTIPEAARHLDLNERTARRVHGRVMERLRSALAEHGIAGDAVAGLSG